MKKCIPFPFIFIILVLTGSKSILADSLLGRIVGIESTNTFTIENRFLPGKIQKITLWCVQNRPIEEAISENPYLQILFQSLLKREFIAEAKGDIAPHHFLGILHTHLEENGPSMESYMNFGLNGILIRSGLGKKDCVLHRGSPPNGVGSP